MCKSFNVALFFETHSIKTLNPIKNPTVNIKKVPKIVTKMEQKVSTANQTTQKIADPIAVRHEFKTRKWGEIKIFETKKCLIKIGREPVTTKLTIRIRKVFGDKQFLELFPAASKVTLLPINFIGQIDF